MIRKIVNILLCISLISFPEVVRTQPDNSIEKGIRLSNESLGKHLDTQNYFSTLQYKISKDEKEGNYQEVVRNCENMVPIVSIFSREKVWYLYRKIAESYRLLGRYDLRWENYFNALNSISLKHTENYAKKLADIQNTLYVSMSDIYLLTRNHSKAIFYYDKAIQHFSTTKAYSSLAIAQAGKAVAYRIVKYPGDSIIPLAKSAYAHALLSLPPITDSLDKDKHHKIDLVARMGCILANSYLEIGNLDSAAFYLEKVESLNPHLIEYTRLYFYMHKGSLYTLKKKWDPAEAYLKKALYISSKFKPDVTVEATVHYLLSSLFVAQGKFEKALDHFTKFHILMDESKELEKVHSINSLEVQYLTERKDREIAEKQLVFRKGETQLREKNIWLYTMSAGCLLLMAMFLVLYRSYRNKKLLHQASLLNMEQGQRISNLQGRVAGEEQERNRIAKELHDGTVSQLLAIKLHLNTISARNNDNTVQGLEEVTREVEVTAQELRQTAHNLMPSLLLDHGLTNAIAFYCEKVQNSSGLVIDFQSIGEDDSMFTKDEELSIFRILQELIQNVLKHAKARSATVQLSQRNDMFTLTVEDKGIGYHAANTGGLGLKNIEERVQLLNGIFDIMSTPGKGTTMYVEIQKYKSTQINP